MKSERQSWRVVLRCEVKKELIVEDCSEEEARTNPYDYAVGDETEIEQVDYKVISVELL